MNKSILSGILFLSFTSIAWADNLLPLTSGRIQNIGNCWAHAGAFMAESNLESKSKLSIVTELGMDLQLLNIYERFLSVFQTKIKFSSGDITDEGGFVGEYMMVLQKHGLLVRAPLPFSGTIPFQYPKSASFKYSKYDDTFNMPLSVAEGLQNRLIKENLKEAEAIALIKNTLKQYTADGEWVQTQTQFAGQTIHRSNLFKEMINPDLVPQTGKPLMIMITSQEDYPDDLELGFSVQDSITIFGVPKRSQVLELVRYSLDHGYSAAFETEDHAMAFMGYKTVNGKFSYAVANSNSDISWMSNLTVDGNPFTTTEVFYNVIKDQLKKYVPDSAITRAPRKISGVIALKH